MNSESRERILIVSSDGVELRRLAGLAERRGHSVLRATSFDGAAQFVGVVPLELVLADRPNEPIFSMVRRSHPHTALVSLADHLGIDTDADKILRRPVDLFVFERLLNALFEPVQSPRDVDESERQPVRARPTQ